MAVSGLLPLMAEFRRGGATKMAELEAAEVG